ncbi:putative chitinase [Seiridium cardinale]|uniref:chitinase n=1 Tax=Seiridium cardinale TaxID=138064 RepID=A0ABR2XG41_9PEZI
MELALFISFLVGCFMNRVAADAIDGPDSRIYPIVPSLELEVHLPLQHRDLPTGTCNAETPCVNAACCGTNGLCGYSPTECGSGNCTSNCDAKAQCGQYGKSGQQDCPLGVCCSEFGFCGSTSDFCNKGCQVGFGGCGDVKRPTCGGNSIAKRTIGYYESWSNTRACQAVAPEDLNLNGFTHLNFAFAFFDPTTFAIAPMDGKSGELYNRFTALKDTRKGLETWISVGGWSFTDPGPTRSAFSDMTSSPKNRQSFISGLISFMENYGFDGVDLDWEYPQADDRGGVTADKDNYVALVKDLRAAFGTRYGISMTLPTSYWYLQHFDLAAIQPNVDWFNFMTYDLHGVWDAQSKFLGPYIAPHTNMTEIDMGLDLLWRAGVEPGKAVLGLGWYGRSFTLADPSCDTPNGVCQFTGGANAGPCSKASGILDLQEITDIIQTQDLEPTWDKEAAVKWITWDSNQWISYDDEDTFDQKRKFANSRCLGGSMVWAIDQVDQKSDNGLAPAPGVSTQDQADAKQLSDNLAAGITCYTTDCEQTCKKGTNLATQMNGQPGKLSTNDRCSAGDYRSLCCDDGTRMGKCQWRGYRGLGLSCMGGCADGETEVVQDTNSHDGNKGDQDCTGGIQSYCCEGFKPAPSGSDILDEVGDAAEDAAEAAAEQAALDIAAKAFCRVAVPALLAPLELLEDLIPIIGEILDIAEVAATPALIQLCTKEIEKTGKAEFKVFGKKHSLSMDKPTVTRQSRPPESSHACMENTDVCQNKFLMSQKWQFHKTITTAIDYEHLDPVRQINCAGNGQHPQACFNYQSISRDNAEYRTITCPYSKPARTYRPVTAEYNGERNRLRWDGKNQGPGMLANPPPGGCSPDEYPPAALADTNDGYSEMTRKPQVEGVGARANFNNRGQLVRLIASVDNGLAGASFRNICPALAPHTEDRKREVVGGGRGGVTTTYVRAVFNRGRYTLAFNNMPNWPDDGLQNNDCAIFNPGPVTHAGYALLNRDGWFDEVQNQAEANLRNGWLTRRRRSRREWVDDDRGLVVIGANSSRVATPEEVRAQFGFDECGDDRCTKELEALRVVVDRVKEDLDPSIPVAVDADATATSVLISGHENEGAVPGSNSGPWGSPEETGSVSNIL